MEPFFISTAIVALAEMGDKTQLLALVLAARFRKPWPIVLGILVATLVNHGLAGAVGAWVTTFLGPQVLRWILGASFIAMAIWMLIPDKLDEGEAEGSPRWGVFGTTLVAFFLAEMGDKTQIATVMLAAQYNAYLWVVAGTTLGMMIANAPVVWLGERITRRVPIRAVHVVSAVIFLVHGASGAEARAQVVHANDEEAVGVHGLAGADHVVPPAFALFLPGVDARHVVRGVEGMAHQYRIGAVGVEGAVGFVGQVVVADGRAALQRQRLRKMHGLGCGDERHKKTRRR
jgi:putative Ca2+/H+ antiporter (TMEM165/GDT1 family)